MTIPKSSVRMVVTQPSYRMANRLRQILVLADYRREAIFEVIDARELMQVLDESAPIHLAMLTPAILADLEQSGLHEALQSRFPEVALLLLEEQDDGTPRSRFKTIPDYTLPPPVTADTLETGIKAALDRRAKRQEAAAAIARGEAALKEGQLTEAQRHFESAVTVDSLDPYPHFALGDLYSVLGDDDQAVSHFARAWKCDPTYYEALQRLVAIYWDRGDRALARPYLEHAAADGSLPVEGLILLAVLSVEAGEAETAREVIERACRQNLPATLDQLLEQARACVAREATTEAIDLLCIGIDVQPENTQLYEFLGDLYLKQERLKEALVCFENLTRLGEPQPTNYCRLARAYLALGFNLRAEKAVQQALKLDPECAEAVELRIAVVG